MSSDANRLMARYTAMVIAIDLDRLAGDVEHRAGEDLHEIGIADRDRERGVFDQIEILAGQRRNDDAHRLRHDDEPQRRAGAQAERLRRFGLTGETRTASPARTTSAMKAAV